MWPKALLELLPHLTRLVPLANNFIQSRTAGDEALRSAVERKLDAHAASLRVDIEKSAEANAALLQQLSRQTATLAQATEGLRALKLSSDALEARLAKFEQRNARHAVLFAILFLQLTTICILIALLFLTRHR